MDTTSPSEKAARVDNQENRMVREKNCNITPFVQLSPRLDDKTPSGNRPRDLQRLRTTARGKDGVVEGGGEDILAASGGGIGQARGESRGRGMEACSKHSR